MKRVGVVAVIYQEPGWEATRSALERLDLPMVYVDRGGVGSLAEAYNRGFDVLRGNTFDLVWFVSNITMEPDTLARLTARMEHDETLAAVHPCFWSDHQFTRPDGTKRLLSAPFVEFTAPLVRADVFAAFPLDEQMPYWGHDLEWGYQVRKQGWQLAIDHAAEVGHVYVRHLEEHPVTRERARLRKQTDVSTSERLVQLHGPRWREKLWRSASSWTATEF